MVSERRRGKEENEKGVLLPRFSLGVRLRWLFIEIHSNTRSPCFLKFQVMPICFYERPALVAVFIN